MKSNGIFIRLLYFSATWWHHSSWPVDWLPRNPQSPAMWWTLAWSPPQVPSHYYCWIFFWLFLFLFSLNHRFIWSPLPYFEFFFWLSSSLPPPPLWFWPLPTLLFFHVRLIGDRQPLIAVILFPLDFYSLPLTFSPFFIFFYIFFIFYFLWFFFCVGLFRDLNPLFVLIFTILTTYVFKVASSEEEGGRRLAYMISNPFLNNVTGVYLSGQPGSNEFNPILASDEASSQSNGKKIWELTEKLIKTNV